MKKKIYYYFHFAFIVYLSFTTVINSYLGFQGLTPIPFNEYLPFFSTAYLHPYTVFTGTNTGYGFYGINVATYSFFEVEIFDEKGDLIDKTTNFDIRNKNSYDRFNSLANKISNYIAENKKYTSEETEKYLKMRTLYINKIFKHVGLLEAKKHEDCDSYRVSLLSLATADIWEDEPYNTNSKININESLDFRPE